jgi:hypothetical protein
LKGESGDRGLGEPSRVFTDYVRASDPAERDVEPVLVELRRALRTEIKRRGLWETSPSYLGIYGAEKWHGETVGGMARSGLGGGPLDELLADCFEYIFVDRLRSLSAQLRVKDDIEGLVFLNVRHFVYERQRDCDPLGARLFQVLQRAVKAAVEAKELAVLAGDPRIRNDTLLTFNSGVEEVASGERGALLAGRVGRWCDDLLPDLVTATGRREDPLVERLRGRLPELWDDGFDVVQFRELIDPLKAEVRGRWATILSSARERLGIAGPSAGPLAGRSERGDADQREERFAAADPEPGPDLAFEQRDAFRALVDCVVRSLARLPGDERSRRTIERLWGYLRVWSAEGGLAGDRLPSHRELASRLGLPRERIPGALETLRGLIEGCRASRVGSVERDANRPETPRPGSH